MLLMTSFDAMLRLTLPVVMGIFFKFFYFHERFIALNIMLCLCSSGCCLRFRMTLFFTKRLNQNAKPLFVDHYISHNCFLQPEIFDIFLLVSNNFMHACNQVILSVFFESIHKFTGNIVWNNLYMLIFTSVMTLLYCFTLRPTIMAFDELTNSISCLNIAPIPWLKISNLCVCNSRCEFWRLQNCWTRLDISIPNSKPERNRILFDVHDFIIEKLVPCVSKIHVNHWKFRQVSGSYFWEKGRFWSRQISDWTLHVGSNLRSQP